MSNALPPARAVRVLVENNEVVSFYDAELLVRSLRHGNGLSEEDLVSLVALHDADHTTDGAREIIAEFLAAYARKLSTEQALADRPLTLRDSGRTVRTHPGAPIFLELEENVARGFQWHLELLDGPGQMASQGRGPGPGSVARFSLVGLQSGRLTVRFREQRARELEPEAGGALPGRFFSLTVLVS